MSGLSSKQRAEMSQRRLDAFRAASLHTRSEALREDMIKFLLIGAVILAALLLVFSV